MIMEAPAPKQEYAGVQLTLENCLFPEEMLTPTPSSKDGLDELAEQDLRLFGCEAIQIAGIMLRLPQVAMATAQVLFHRFFFVKSFVKFKMEEAAMACIWLASKVEEAPRRVRDVLNVFHYMKERKKKVSSPAPLQLDGNYVSLKSNVIKLEKKLLKELGFCVHVKHPHKIIVIYLQQLDMERNLDLVQTSWNYMNDSLRSTVFVKYRPETIACACIYMAARVLQVPLPNQPHWFYLFNATEEEIQKISAEILQVYHRKRVSLDELDTKLEACRQKLRDERIKAREAATAAAEAENAGSMSDSAASPKDKKSDEKASSKHDDNRDESKRKSSQKSEQSSSANSSKHQRSSSIPHHSKYDNEDSGRHRSPHRHSRPKSRPSSSSRNKPPPEFDLPKSYSSYDGDDSHKSKSSSKSRDHKRSYHRSSGGSHKRNKHEHVSRSSSPPEKSHKSSHKKHSKHKHAHE